LNISSPKKRTAPFARKKRQERDEFSNSLPPPHNNTETEERRGVEVEKESKNGWILDDFLATRTDRGVVVRFGRDWSGVTGVRPTD
tara:strand:- start:413 stop:670 length:258 start_codon:yes stop_codon:yes gene_type:complete